jgi:hypothetical protein
MSGIHKKDTSLVREQLLKSVFLVLRLYIGSWIYKMFYKQIPEGERKKRADRWYCNTSYGIRRIVSGDDWPSTPQPLEAKINRSRLPAFSTRLRKPFPFTSRSKKGPSLI